MILTKYRNNIFRQLKLFLGRFWDGAKKINKAGHQVSIMKGIIKGSPK